MLLDHNSPDGLRDWVLTTFTAELTSGRLKLFSERTYPRFLTPRAKNIAHLLGQGNVLINVDADNFLTPDYLEILQETPWQRYELLSAKNTPPPARRKPGEHAHIGGRGRLGILRSVFTWLGGYNETLNGGWGSDEVDLEWRAEKAGCRTAAFIVPEHSWMDNTREERSKPLLPRFNNSPMTSQNYNRQLSLQQIKEGKLRANLGCRWGQATVFDHADVAFDVGFTPTTEQIKARSYVRR